MALVLIGRTTGSGWTMVIVSGLVGVAVAALVWPALALRRVTVAVAAPADAVRGRPIEVDLRLGGGATSVTARPFLRYATGELVDPGSLASADVPSAGRLTVTPPRRGVVTGVQMELRCGAPLGLVFWRRRLDLVLQRALEVAPQPEEVALPAVAHGDGGDRHRPERRSGHDSVRTVRDYVPGDAIKLVHWGLTARRGELTVKELEDPEGASVAVVVDLRGDPDLAERSAARAAGLCTVALRGGLEVILCTAEDGGGRSERVSSPLAAGRRLARAVPGAPADPPAGMRVVRLP